VRSRVFLAAALALAVAAAATAQSSPTPGSPAAQVIAAARDMASVTCEIVQGDCWDFVNAVYYRAGFPPSAREQVYLTKASGPYADPALLEPGDWVYLAAEGTDWEHSVIFVRWLGPIDEGLAEVAEYAGSFRPEAGVIQGSSIPAIWGIFRARAATSPTR
jgi:hypothetical protein